jgi:hypothetical protein
VISLRRLTRFLFAAMEASTTTKQLWSMTSGAPIGASWTESMKLGANLHAQARDEFLADVQDKNARMAEQLGLCLMRLHLAGEAMKKLTVRTCVLSFPTLPAR